MAKITIGGAARDVQPLGFRAIRRAAPHIRDMLALVRDAGAELSAIVEYTAGVREILYIVAIAELGAKAPEDAIEKLVDELEDKLTFEEAQTLQTEVIELMTESGFLKRGDGPGELPPAESPPEPSKSSSTGSSSSSSPPESAPATGSE